MIHTLIHLYFQTIYYQYSKNQVKQRKDTATFFQPSYRSVFPSMNPSPACHFKAILILIIVSILAGFFWWLFYERYYQYKECIEAAASSCLTAQGDNLTSGGMLWAAPAMLLSGLALYYLARVIRQH
ncbi:MAG: hypothetical protein KA194_05200 [Alcaligenes sp.]|nr:hypothetical protein [Alcaligenes sp.]